MSKFEHGMIFENEEGDIMRIVGETEPHQYEVDTWWNGSFACMGEEVHESEFFNRRLDLETAH